MSVSKEEREEVLALVRELGVVGRELGLARIKVADLELEFGAAPRPAAPTVTLDQVEADGVQTPRKVPIGEEKGAPTEDELLFPPGMAPEMQDGKPVFVHRLPFGGLQAVPDQGDAA